MNKEVNIANKVNTPIITPIDIPHKTNHSNMNLLLYKKLYCTYTCSKQPVSVIGINIKLERIDFIDEYTERVQNLNDTKEAYYEAVLIYKDVYEKNKEQK